MTPEQEATLAARLAPMLGHAMPLAGELRKSLRHCTADDLHTMPRPGINWVPLVEAMSQSGDRTVGDWVARVDTDERTIQP